MRASGGLRGGVRQYSNGFGEPLVPRVVIVPLMSLFTASTPILMIRYRLVLVALMLTLGAPPLLAQPHRDVRAALERAYKENADAYMRGDVRAVMALRAPDFHTVGPDGALRDRAAMEQYTTGFIYGVRKWNAMTLTIDSLDVRADTAFVTMTQHLDRMALRPDNAVHHVETWATQREIWVWTGSRWLLWRVDQVRDQRRLVDGKLQ